MVEEPATLARTWAMSEVYRLSLDKGMIAVSLVRQWPGLARRAAVSGRLTRERARV